MSLLVLLQYAHDNGLTAWQAVGEQLFAAYNDDRIGTALGLSKGAGGTGDADPSAQMLTEIAYSAISQGTMPFGDTGIQALFHDADALGQFYLSAALPQAIMSASTSDDLAEFAVEYAGLLAKVGDTEASHANGIINYYLSDDDLEVKSSNSKWNIGVATPPNIIGEAELIESLFFDTQFASVSSVDNLVIGSNAAGTINLSSDTATDMVFAGDGNVTLNTGSGTTSSRGRGIRCDQR